MHCGIAARMRWVPGFEAVEGMELRGGLALEGCGIGGLRHASGGVMLEK